MEDAEYKIEAKWPWVITLPFLVGFPVSLLLLGAYLLYASNPLSSVLTAMPNQPNPTDLLFIIFFILDILFFGIVISWTFIVAWLNQKTFSLTLKPEFISVIQGILSKQNRFIPYAKIQDVILKQDLMGKFFNLATLTIENAAQLGGTNLYRYSQSSTAEQVGSTGNFVNFPGLNYGAAKQLRESILQKAKEYKANNKSGL